ncbi:hypothetical protein COT48_01625 [Candidatus Woesearchaeota archaeon CG08_land_8_20_14_0_20_47_9]|nr:MAG: hypothetical protein AUJ69_00220 [Candidatus Woesearchaeota archaeon CG1_02_47_18]PIN72593.1 MAG: hypothetical protein COV22_02825 [Candidatus Woesearchaeota archaeon CG10_big_fil_rev_8_21_14_0_10_47_5]PIO04209.1 MAG: hypothetical protein COT48_01625 [Candidatus Woesearchaeota archaeon CG08_land_8_20_14_0_20_47_9]HII30016.1 hypothetical protein [Candidatus Woesearchaeota archaeon]
MRKSCTFSLFPWGNPPSCSYEDNFGIYEPVVDPFSHPDVVSKNERRCNYVKQTLGRKVSETPEDKAAERTRLRLIAAAAALVDDKHFKDSERLHEIEDELVDLVESTEL